MTTTPPPELQELLTLVASWREKSSEAGRKAARARQLPDDYETASERVFDRCADELELAWARLADAKARTTPNPELPESVVTELLPCPFCGGEAVSTCDEDNHIHMITCNECGGSTDWCDSEEDAVSAWNTRTAAESVRAANARAEGLEKPLASFRAQLIAQVEANKQAAINSPQCADWSNGVAQGFQEALIYLDAAQAVRSEASEREG